MMIVGEAPGRDEDASGQPFVGDAGNLMWNGGRGVRGILSYGLGREHFHVTNVCKCWPSASKTPKGINVTACSKYLQAEIEAVKPFVILSFGNTGLRFFKGVDKGIMDASGTTEWSDKYGCWVCYCMHPASVLYHTENAPKVDAGINNFVTRINTLGFGG
jgi:DNA polymerase